MKPLIQTNITPFLGLLCRLHLCIAQVAVPEVPPEVVASKVLHSTSDNDTPCKQACAAVAARHPGAVFVGQTGKFEFWDSKQAELVPACRVEPSSAQEVSVILKEVVAKKCHFAVKSGGHDRTANSSNAEGGVTIDLVRLNDIRLAEDKKTVTIGAGLRWGDVYSTLEKEQLMVLGGRISDVGVGGLLLGGGISFYSNERGLACDSIISYEMVLSNGSIITADQQSHPALYKALRGAGGSNFGIVTAFTLEVFPLLNPNGIWTGQKLYPWTDVEPLLHANYKTVTEHMDADPGIAVMQIFVCHVKHRLCYGAIQSQHTSHQSTEHWPASLEQYNQVKGLPATVNMHISRVSNITEMLAGTSPPGSFRNIYGAFSYSPSIELESRMLAVFREVSESMHDVTGFLPGLIMHPFSTRMISKMQKRGGNALQSVANHKGPLVILNVSWQWKEKIDDDRAYASYFRLMARLEELAKELRVWHPYKYVNYAEASQEVWEGYGEQSATELRRLQREVDPAGVFTKGGLAGGFFKLNTFDQPHKSGNQPSWDKSEL